MWRKKLFRFLKEKGVFQLYIDNINEQHPVGDSIFWEEMWKNEVLSEENKCVEGIDYAFGWDDTKQGHDFWSKIDDEWKDKCHYYYSDIWFGEEDSYDS